VEAGNARSILAEQKGAMINPLALISKLKKGQIDQDQVAEMLSQLGIEASFTPVPQAEAFPQFEGLAASASLPSAQLVRLNLKMKGGQQFDGLLVLSRHTGT
jgi:hypothetical protein